MGFDTIEINLVSKLFSGRTLWILALYNYNYIGAVISLTFFAAFLSSSISAVAWLVAVWHAKLKYKMKNKLQQAGAEVGHAQLKLRLGFTTVFMYQIEKQ